nr:PREDICTED: protein ripply2 [Opisthocomus hoazin]
MEEVAVTLDVLLQDLIASVHGMGSDVRRRGDFALEEAQDLLPKSVNGLPCLVMIQCGRPRHGKTRLFWPRSRCYDYLYQEAEALLKNFPVQATISFYEDSDSEDDEDELEQDSRTESDC